MSRQSRTYGNGSYSVLGDIGDLKVAEPCSYKLGESSVGWKLRQSSSASSYSRVIAAGIFDDILVEVNFLVERIGDFKVVYIDEDGEDESRVGWKPHHTVVASLAKFFSVDLTALTTKSFALHFQESQRKPVYQVAVDKFISFGTALL
jgi:hypothetical protein